MRQAAVFFWAAALLAQHHPLMLKGNDHFYNVEFEEALATYKQLAAVDPESPGARNRIAHSYLYLHMHRTGALESELVTGTNPFLRRATQVPSAEEQKAFFEAIDQALKLADARIAKNPRDAGAFYQRGVALGLRANYSFLVTKGWIDALRDITNARKNHEQAVAIDPGLIDARLILGVHDYVVGSLPWHYKALAFLVGFRGDKERGLATLREVWDKGQINSSDAGILLAAIYRRERRAKDAIPLVQELIRRFPRNYIIRMELAQMYSDAGDQDKAMAVLAEVEELKRRNAPGFTRLKLEKVHYLRGTIAFWYGDLDLAESELRRVTSQSDKLDLNTAVYSWMRLGQTLDLKGRRSDAVAAYRRAVAIAPDSDPGREARSHLNRPYVRKAA
jgi:tetratricopeptide (TPR) repeat protein